MSVFTNRGVDIFAPTDAAGSLRKVINGEVQVWSTEVERAVYYAMVSGNLAYATKADLDADLDHEGGTVAWVVADTEALNGIYVKSGASGSGSWTKERNLPTGPQGDVGGVAYRFDAGTADADPGAGLIRANNADLSAATELYVSKSNRYGDDLSGFLATLAGSTSTHKGYLVLTAPDSETQAAFNVTGVADAAGYVKLAVTGPGGVTGFEDAERLIFLFLRTGNAGDLNGVNPGVAGLTVLEAETREDARLVLGVSDFPTKAAAEASVFDIGPQYIMIAGYASAGDGGGALYKKVASEPTHAGKLSITLADGLTVNWYEMIGEVAVEAFGAFTTSAASANKLALEAASNYSASTGWPVTMRQGQVFNHDPIQIADGSHFKTRGAVFAGSSVNEVGGSFATTPTVLVGDRVTADMIVVKWSGYSVNRLVSIGEKPDIGFIHIERTDAQNEQDLTNNYNVALNWDGGGKTGRLGGYSIKNCDLSMRVTNVFGQYERAVIGKGSICNYIRGIWFKTCFRLVFDAPHIEGVSPTISGWRGGTGSYIPGTGPGENGVLYEDCSEITRNGTLTGGDSWSHFERVGGHNSVGVDGKLTLPDGSKRNPGAYILGDIQAKSHGGSAFKCNTSVATNYIRGLKVGDVISIDGGIDRAPGNSDTVRLQHIDGFQIGKISSSPSNISSGSAADWTFLFSNCKRGTVGGAQGARTKLGLIYGHSGDGPIEDVTIQTHSSNYSLGDGVKVAMATGNTSGLMILGGQVRNSVGTGYDIEITSVREGCRVEGVSGSNGADKSITVGSTYGAANFIDDIVTVPG
ncbi:hypothetical protein [Nitratireductor sp. OM-1]|uniref:hypothetical protein n=1 Tax=Nitratireductor sp. OM-1 TaxID=1756988 RepID=UPI000DDF3C21|nr:hypothetical protein [Nitratireductor sp. OM-1]